MHIKYEQQLQLISTATIFPIQCSSSAIGVLERGILAYIEMCRCLPGLPPEVQFLYIERTLMTTRLLAAPILQRLMVRNNALYTLQQLKAIPRPHVANRLSRTSLPRLQTGDTSIRAELGVLCSSSALTIRVFLLFFHNRTVQNLHSIPE